MALDNIGRNGSGKITITPAMEITRGTTTYSGYCYTHYIIFEVDGEIYITGTQSSYWDSVDGNVVVPSTYVLRLARNREAFNKMPLSEIEENAYCACMNGAR